MKYYFIAIIVAFLMAMIARLVLADVNKNTDK